MTARGPYETKTHEGGPRTLGDRLRVLRLRNGRTQAQLAEDLHTDQAQVSAWERDKARPSKAILGALAAHFQIDLTLLDSGDEFLAWLQRPQVEPSSSPLPPFPELPDPGAGGRLLIDRTRGDIRPVEGMEALQLVMGAMHEGRKVWILIE